MRLLERMFPAPTASAGEKTRRKRGFTLIELMVVVSIIGISATITFASINTDKYSVAVQDFAEEMGAEVMRARDTAIDLQTTVDLEFFPIGLQMSMIDPTTGNQLPLRYLRKSEFGGSRLGNEVCVLGVYPLLYAPGDPVPATIPQVQCPSGGLEAPFATIRFGPDGTYEVDNGSVAGYTRNGWSVIVRDGRASEPAYAMIELFPTGMVRVIQHVTNESM